MRSKHAYRSGSVPGRTLDVSPGLWRPRHFFIHCVISKFGPKPAVPSPTEAEEGRAKMTGFEPATRGFGDRCSGHLSYTLMCRAIELRSLRAKRKGRTHRGFWTRGESAPSKKWTVYFTYIWITGEVWKP